MTAGIRQLNSVGARSVEHASSLLRLNPRTESNADAETIFSVGNGRNQGFILRSLRYFLFQLGRPIFSSVWRGSILTIALAPAIAANRAAAAELSEPLNVQLEPCAGENFSCDVFQCWLPESGVTPKGIPCIVLQPRDHRRALLADPGPWKQLSSQYDCALIAALFAECSDSAKPWAARWFGSGQALLRAIYEVSTKSGVVELKSAPIVLAGVCEADQFANAGVLLKGFRQCQSRRG